MSDGNGKDMRAFAEKFRLRLGRAEDGELVVRAKLGHLYCHDADRFGVVFIADADDSRLDNTLRSRIRRAICSGCQPHQVANFEAVLLFDPTDARLSRLVLKLVGCRRKKKPSECQLEALKKASQARARQRVQFSPNPSLEAPERPQTATISPRQAPTPLEAA